MKPPKLILATTTLLIAGLLSSCAPAAPNGWSTADEKKATELFTQLCKTQVKETIYQVATNVDGYLWVSLWPRFDHVRSTEYARQVRDPNLAAPPDFCGSCLAAPGALLLAPITGAFVEVEEPGTHRVTRAQFGTKPPSPRDVEIARPTARYAVSFEDATTPAMRALWVGGSRLKVTDRETGKLMAERLSFVRGNPARLRGPFNTGPWGQTVSCSNDPLAFISFTQKVLIPSTGASK